MSGQGGGLRSRWVQHRRRAKSAPSLPHRSAPAKPAVFPGTVAGLPSASKGSVPPPRPGRRPRVREPASQPVHRRPFDTWRETANHRNTVLPWVLGSGSAAAFLLFCRANHVGLVYTFNATLLCLLITASLVFVLLTGRLRLAASYSDGEFRAFDVPTGRVIGTCLAALMLALLVVGASPLSQGDAIRTVVSWYALHYGDVAAAVTNFWVILALFAVSLSIVRAVKRRQWRRASSALLGFLALSVLATTVIGAWLLAEQHAWWPYLWAVCGLVVAAALGVAAVTVGEAADRSDRVGEPGRARVAPRRRRRGHKARGKVPVHPVRGRDRPRDVQSRRRR